MQTTLRLQPLLLAFFCAVTTPFSRAAPADASDALEALRSQTPVPAIAAALSIDGRLVAAGVAGVRRQGSSEAVTPQDRFHIGSCTKAMTATLAAVLVEQGQLRWNTSLGETFPETAGATAYADVTLEQLLAHRSGLLENPPGPLWSELRTASDSPLLQRRALLEGVVGTEPQFVPGSSYLYSNTGYALAGHMMETVAEKTWEQLMQECIFDPLGLSSAGFGAPATEGEVDQPWGHVRQFRFNQAIEPGPMADNPSAIAPAGAVHLSIADFVRFASLHAGGVRHPDLEEATLQSLHEPRSSGEQPYGLGWVVTQRPWADGVALHHAGSNTTFFSVMWVAPERGLAIVAAANLGGDAGWQACDAAVGMLLREYGGVESGRNRGTQSSSEGL